MDDRQRQFAQLATALNQYANNPSAERNSRERSVNDGRSSTGSTSSGSSSSSGGAAAAALWGDLSRALQYNYSGISAAASGGSPWPNVQGGSDFHRFSSYGSLGDVAENRLPVDTRIEGRRVPSKGETKATPPLPPGLASSVGSVMALQQLVGLPNEEVYRSLLAQQYAAAAAFSGMPSGTHTPISPIPPSGHSSPSPGQVRGSPALSTRQTVEKHLQQMQQRQRTPSVSLPSAPPKSTSPVPLLSMVGNVALPPLSSPECNINGDYFDTHIHRHQSQISPLMKKDRLELGSVESHHSIRKSSPNLHSPLSSSLSPINRLPPHPPTERDLMHPHYSDNYGHERDHPDKKSDFGNRSGSESEGDSKGKNRRKQDQPKRQTVIYPASGQGSAVHQNFRGGAPQMSSSEESDEYESTSNRVTSKPQRGDSIISNPSVAPLSIGQAMSHALSHPFLAGHINSSSDYLHMQSGDAIPKENNSYNFEQNRSYDHVPNSKTGNFMSDSYQQDTVSITRISNKNTSFKDSDSSSFSSANNSYDSIDKNENVLSERTSNLPQDYDTHKEIDHCNLKSRDQINCYQPNTQRKDDARGLDKGNIGNSDNSYLHRSKDTLETNSSKSFENKTLDENSAKCDKNISNSSEDTRWNESSKSGGVQIDKKYENLAPESCNISHESDKSDKLSDSYTTIDMKDIESDPLDIPSLGNSSSVLTAKGSLVNGLLSPKGKEGNDLADHVDKTVVTSDNLKCTSQVYNGNLKPMDSLRYKADYPEEVNQDSSPETKRSTRQKRPVSYVEDETDPFGDLTEDIPYTSPVRKRGRRSKEKGDIPEALSKQLEFKDVLNHSSEEEISNTSTGMVPQLLNIPPELRKPLHIDTSHSFRMENANAQIPPDNIEMTSEDTCPTSFDDVKKHEQGLEGEGSRYNTSEQLQCSISPIPKEGFPYSTVSPTMSKTHSSHLQNSLPPDSGLCLPSNHPHRALDIPSLEPKRFSPGPLPQPPQSSYTSSSLLTSCKSSKIVDEIELQLAALHKEHIPEPHRPKSSEIVDYQGPSFNEVQNTKPHKPMLSIVPLEQLTYEGLKKRNMDPPLEKEHLQSISENKEKQKQHSGLESHSGNENSPIVQKSHSSSQDICEQLFQSKKLSNNLTDVDTLTQSIPRQESQVQVVSISNVSSFDDNNERINKPVKNTPLNEQNSQDCNGSRPETDPSPSKVRRSRRAATQNVDGNSAASLDDRIMSADPLHLPTDNGAVSRAPPSHESLEAEMALEKSLGESSQYVNDKNRDNTVKSSQSAETLEDIAKFLEDTATTSYLDDSLHSESVVTNTSNTSMDSVASSSGVSDSNYKEGRPKRVSRPPPEMNEGEMNDLLLLLNMDDDESEDEDYIPFDAEDIDGSEEEQENNEEYSENEIKKSKSLSESKIKRDFKKDSKKFSKKVPDSKVLQKIKKNESKRKSDDKFDRRGPIVKLVADHEYEAVINDPDKDDDDQEKSKKNGIPWNIELEAVGRSAKVGFSSTLHNNYDAFEKDISWFCVFCKNYSHYQTLGDLYGPFYVNKVNVVKKHLPEVIDGQIPNQSIVLNPSTSSFLSSKSKYKKRRDSISGDLPTQEPKKVEFGGCSPPSRFVPAATPARMLGRSPSGSSPRVPPSPVKSVQSSSMKEFGNSSSQSRSGGSNPSGSEGWTPPSGVECWAHESCIVWSPGVSLNNGQLIGLEQAVAEAQESTCCHCGESGATVCCLGRKCGSAVHVPCAASLGWALNEITFQSFCPTHSLVKKAVMKRKSSLQKDNCY